jgi:hypothetical protein
LAEPEALAYGPLVKLIPGTYRASFALRAPEGLTTGRVADIDVFSKTAGGELASLAIDASAFKSDAAYQDFDIVFETTQPWPDIEFRVFPDGAGSVLVDRVQLSYLLK